MGARFNRRPRGPVGRLVYLAQFEPGPHLAWVQGPRSMIANLGHICIPGASEIWRKPTTGRHSVATYVCMAVGLRRGSGVPWVL